MSATAVRDVQAPVFDAERVRRDFPILSRIVHDKALVYLDSAASAQMPLSVVRAIDDYELRSHANVHRGVHALSEEATAAFEGARDRVRRFLHAHSSREIIFVRGTTEAINLVAQSYARPRFGPGDEILITALEHHANIVPWQMVRQQTGCSLVVAPINRRGELEMDEFLRRLSARTRLVAVAHVSNALGTILPVAEIVAAARARGMPVLIDGAQAVPHQKVDVRALDCDFYAFSSHKLYGPTGIGALYGRRALLKAMRPFNGGGEMIAEVSRERVTYAEPPARFEAGTPPIIEAVGLAAALDWLSSFDREAIGAHERELLAHATEEIGALNWVRIIGSAPGKGAILSFESEGMHAHDVATILDREGVAVRAGHHCAQPLMERFGVSSTTRASFSLYNTHEEVEALVQALRKARGILG